MLLNNFLSLGTQGQIGQKDVAFMAQKGPGECQIDTCVRWLIISFAPLRENARENCAVPEPAPVTMAVLPAREIAMASKQFDRRKR